MTIANLDGRSAIVTDSGSVDIAKASDGALPSDPDAAVACLEQTRSFVATVMPEPDIELSTEDLLADLSLSGPPVTAPRQIFAVGLNYLDHGSDVRSHLS